MNQPLNEEALNIESFQNENLWDTNIEEQSSYQFDSLIYSCHDCRGLTFENASNLEKHLVDQHLKVAEVLLQRLTEAAIHRLNQRRNRPRKGAFARKRSHSYIVPRVKSGKKASLKLKLKVSGDSNSRSFEVVPVQKVLVGPGGLYPVNGGDLSEVKTENFLTDVEWEKSLEGSSEQPEVAASGERTLNESPTTCEKENSVDSDKSSEDIPGDDLVDDVALENSKDSEDGDLLTIGKEELDIPPSPAPTPASTPLPTIPSPATSPVSDSVTPPLGTTPVPVSDALSPSSGDQLDSEFLPPESETEFSQSPNMVEINNSSVADVRSPAFPTTSSPATPGHPTPPLEQQSTQSSGETQPDENADSEELSSSEHLHCDDPSTGSTSNDFEWTDVASNEVDLAGDAANSQALEERDPLLLNDPSTSSEDQGGDMQGPNSGSIEGNEQSILRGFLAEHNSERTSVPVSGVSGLEGFTLGSEYISLERLGDNAVICDVCGERSTDQTALQEHKFRSGHFKCSHPECNGVIYSSADELIAHQQNIHSSQQFTQQNILNQSQNIMNQQTAPVQQLVQQVQRLPVPQMPLQSLNKAQPPHPSTMSQQLTSNMVTLIPSQQNPFPGAVCRPPPLYPAPAPNLMQQQHAPPPPYPGPQHVMFPQAYPPHNQSFTTSPRQPMQMQPRPYSTMIQQLNQHTIRQQAPRVQVPGVQQRGMVSQNAGSPGGTGQPGKRTVQSAPNSPANKQRRLDLLIPDRHDDADCHVIAMQKRTDSGPVITGVQGSAPSTQPPGVPSSRQSPQADSTINLTDSITLSVRGQNSSPTNGGKSRNDANSVASLLATRGITVTPAGAAGRGNPSQPPQPQPQPQPPRRQPATSVPAPPPPQPVPQPVTTLNLNSAISIIPTASVRQPPKQQQLQQPQQPGGNFAVPQGRSASRPQQQAQVERPPRPPTVDLTGDGPPPPPALNPMGGRGRGRGRGTLGRNQCQLCDKPFATLDALNQHMITHRPGKLPFRCNMCTAQYPTQQGLLQHRQSFHKETPSPMGSELVLPVVDLKQPATLNRLSSLGVRHYIPLSQLSNQSGGLLGLPIVSLEGGRIPSANLSALGAGTILTLGPLRQLPR